jgi:muramoyltetrapeptide carboxypeptidase
LPRKPSPLRTGDRVCLVAPSGAWDAGRLTAGVEILTAWGLEVTGPHGSEPLRYFSAHDHVRAEELAGAFCDPAVRAVLAVRGGSGAARTFRSLDMRTIAANPKVFVGFSDLTLLLDRVLTEADLICFHGPMIGVDLPRVSDAARESFRRFLFGEDGWFEATAREQWRDGLGEGILKGGCLAVMVTTLGTPYEIDTSGTVLFIEDVAEPPYALDRMLTHLKHAGKFDEVAGVVLGPMESCDGGHGTAFLREIVMDVLEDFDFPVLFGIEAGHGADNRVLPLGARVRFDSTCSGLELLERVFE